MPSYVGELTVCDRCGKTVFRKKIKDEECDGGYTRYATYEPYPEGWEHFYLSTRNAFVWVCPDCYARIASMFEKEFKEEG